VASKHVIDPITRIEGHLRIEIDVGDDGRVEEAASSSTAFRGFETIMRGRDPRDVGLFAQRICGVCTYHHYERGVEATERAYDVRIPPNARVVSDPVALTVEEEQDLVTNLYTANTTGPTTWHALPTKTSYVSETGDHTTDPSGAAFTTEVTSWFFLDGIEVLAPDADGAIVALGNSITDGYASTIDANAAYPDVLAERINDREGLHKAVLNAGISGNRLLNNSDCCGVNAIARLDRDVVPRLPPRVGQDRARQPSHCIRDPSARNFWRARNSMRARSSGGAGRAIELLVPGSPHAPDQPGQKR
jgi:hypothetical protein